MAPSFQENIVYIYQHFAPTKTKDNKGDTATKHSR